MPDEVTCKEIDKAINTTLKYAGLSEPPFLIEDILEYLDVDREFYDLEDVTLLRRFWHKVKVRGQKLIKIVKKTGLRERSFSGTESQEVVDGFCGRASMSITL